MFFTISGVPKYLTDPLPETSTFNVRLACTLALPLPEMLITEPEAESFERCSVDSQIRTDWELETLFTKWIFNSPSSTVVAKCSSRLSSHLTSQLPEGWPDMISKLAAPEKFTRSNG